MHQAEVINPYRPFSDALTRYNMGKYTLHFVSIREYYNWYNMTYTIICSMEHPKTIIQFQQNLDHSPGVHVPL